jgi:hypothetical protein
MSNTANKAPRPRLRTSGGIVIGQGHTLLGRMPMAIADETPSGRVSSTFDFTGYHVLGMPIRAGGSFQVGPVTSPRTRLLSDIWTGNIPADGCQFWLTEKYALGKYSAGGSPTVYLFDGTTTALGQPTITIRDIDSEDEVGSYPAPDTSSSSHEVEAAWLISIVKQEAGRYYLSKQSGTGGLPSRYPLSGKLTSINDYLPLPVWPDGYESEYPI